MNKKQIQAEKEAFKRFTTEQEKLLHPTHYASWQKGWDAHKAYIQHRKMMNEDDIPGGCLYVVAAVVLAIVLLIIFL